MKCIECGRSIADGEAYFDNAAARALIPFAGRLMSDGPFCSKGCKRNHLEAKETVKETKALKKEASFSERAETRHTVLASADLVEQRQILELQKEEREAAERRRREMEEAEELRQRQAKASQLRAQGHPTRAFLLHNQNTVWGIVFAYLIGTLGVAVKLVKHRHMSLVWTVSGVVLCLVAALIIWRIVRENAQAKQAVIR